MATDSKVVVVLLAIIVALTCYIVYSSVPVYQLQTEQRVLSTNTSMQHVQTQPLPHVFDDENTVNVIDRNMDPCIDDNSWLQDILSKFTPLFDYNTLHRVYINHSSQSVPDLSAPDHVPAIMLIVSVSLSLNDSFAYWQQLDHGSLYIQKVNTVNDILVVGRYLELTQWDHAVFYYNKRQHDFQQMFIGDVLCSQCGCVAQKETHKLTASEFPAGYGAFYDVAKTTKTDKISKHAYNVLYDKQLSGLLHVNKGVFLEIGLGCGMAYGAGESAKIWTQLFNHVHFIEYDADCVAAHRDEIEAANYTVHVGDQADMKFLEQLKTDYLWQSEHGVDVIIDDGGHWNHQIIKSFLSLWQVLNSNGLYFIEDYGESAYDRNYHDSQPVAEFGAERPGTANYFVKNLLFNLFCAVSKRTCYEIEYVEARLDICVIRKQSTLTHIE